MTLELWLYYTLAILVLTASPGPSVLLCLTTSVTDGFRSAIYTALGSLTAITGIITLSFSGLGIVVATSELAFNIIKWTGAAYLIYLGIRALTSSQQSYEIEGNEASSSPRKPGNLFLRGFIVGASNPKAIVFFTALFPQFITPSASLVTQYLVFVVTFAVLELSWLLFYAWLGARSSRWLMQAGRARFFNKITGGVFVSAGLILSSTRASA
ncbi:flagellar biosynthesis protein FlgM [Elysia marginata]|uniref:Flagellar biosynthesis protein FlgM n=1 Tax=Elysia marginata TaxID=1093978 RepID=A0AAV4FC53_9GAST|nr:flagellar biosynthesis protein FlgM [Elysia marginata]